MRVIRILACWWFVLAARPLAAGVAPAPFDLQQRRASHWAWQPIRPQTPPDVAHPAWARDPIDRFILAKLEAKRIEPAAPADRRTLIRRISFALIGLGPTPEEVDSFLNDQSPQAYEKVVDRLLASPRFGERWARHWMDLVRYADTLGNESDAPIPNAWQYRDYLIRAFNSDVPYNQLVIEHLAGDLLEHPRRDPGSGINESIIGTGFFWMNEDKRSPVDVKQAEADCFDNKIDVMCKTFLGLTVGCARCHDHKFDAISQKDYYALYGYLKSSRYTQALLNAQELDSAAAELMRQKTLLREAAATVYREQAASVGKYLMASQQATTRPVEAVASDADLSPSRLEQWIKALKEPAVVEQPFFAWQAAGSVDAEDFAARWSEAAQKLQAREAEAAKSAHRDGDIELSDFTAHGYSGWFHEDQAFGDAPSPPGDFLPGDSVDRPIQTLVRGGAWAHSASVSRRLQGTLRSATFTIDRRYLHVFCAGRGARINVNIEHFVMIQDPLYGALRYVPGDDAPHWHTFDLGMWKGRQAYVELADTTTPDLHDLAPSGIDPNGYLAVGRVVLSDQGPPQLIDPPPARGFLGDDKIDSPQSLAERYQSAIVESVAAFADGRLPALPHADARANLLEWLIDHHLLDGTGTAIDRDVRLRIGEILTQWHEIESNLPAPQRAPATVDGTAEDEQVFLRGDHKHGGPISPRRMLAGIAGDDQPAPPASGSGRLQLARQFADAANPLTSRVLVNRVWYHLFGEGIVASVDNFGALGDVPTYPQLLDYLADGFVKDGWSIKRLIRRIVLSNSFQMSSRGNPAADAVDPQNKLLHRANVRRLEGEAIRDQILQVSGRLDLKMSGPGVEVYLTPFLAGNYVADYGIPKQSGPLDGDGRRSVYMMVRRNFLSPLMVAFDAPPPINTAGRRTVSNVPSQALILMNDPFVAQQAHRWAERMLALKDQTSEQRIRTMYLEAYARPPDPAELQTARQFLDEHGQELNVALAQRDSDVQLWADLAHVLINVKEFIFLN